MTNIFANLAYLYQKYSITPMPEKFPYKPCRIADSNGDLSKVWYVEYYAWDEISEKLKRKRVVLDQTTAKKRYEEGKIISKEINKLLEDGSVVNPKPKKAVVLTDAVNSNTPILKAIEYFLKFNKKTLKPNTYDTYQSDFNRFEKFLKRNNLQDLPISQFDEVKAIAFLDELIVINEISNRSRNNVKGTAGTMFNFFKKRKIISTNPFAEISKLPAIAEKHTAFSKKHAKEIINTCIEQKETQLLLFIYFMYYAFTRPGQELRLLKIGDIREKTIFITAENAKDGTSEHIMIPAPLEKIIQDYKLRDYPKEHYIFSKNNLPGEKPNGEKYQYMRHVGILRKLNIKNLKYDTYSWKHTGVIALFQATQNIELIRQQCRHSDIATTQKYLRDLGQFVDYDQINKFPEI